MCVGWAISCVSGVVADILCKWRGRGGLDSSVDVLGSSCPPHRTRPGRVAAAARENVAIEEIAYRRSTSPADPVDRPGPASPAPLPEHGWGTPDRCHTRGAEAGALSCGLPDVLSNRTRLWLDRGPAQVESGFGRNRRNSGRCCFIVGQHQSQVGPQSPSLGRSRPNFA